MGIAMSHTDEQGIKLPKSQHRLKVLALLHTLSQRKIKYNVRTARSSLSRPISLHPINRHSLLMLLPWKGNELSYLRIELSYLPQKLSDKE